MQRTWEGEEIEGRTYIIMCKDRWEGENTMEGGMGAREKVLLTLFLATRASKREGAEVGIN